MLQEEVQDLGQQGLLPDLKRIHSAGKHLLALIDDILDLSKIEAGKMALRLEEFEVSELVEEMVSTLHPTVEKNRNRLDVHLAKEVGSMRADITKVRQILFNLVSNACKFTRGGNISLQVDRSASDGQEWTRFRVS